MSTHRYRLEPTNTFAAVIVRNDTSKLLSRLGHDHVIRAREFTSTIVIDPLHREAISFSLAFPVDALDVDETQDRKRVDLPGEVSTKDRDATRDNMLGRGQLNAKAHGNIHFQVHGAQQSDQEDELILKASLTVRGHRHDFDFPVHFQLTPHLRVKGRVDLTHDDLGMKAYRAPMGTLQNQETLTFVVDADVAPL